MGDIQDACAARTQLSQCRNATRVSHLCVSVRVELRRMMLLKTGEWDTAAPAQCWKHHTDTRCNVITSRWPSSSGPGTSPAEDKVQRLVLWHPVWTSRKLQLFYLHAAPCSTIWRVRLSRLLVGFRTHFQFIS